MKKITATVLSLVLAMGMLSGCGSNMNATKKTEDSKEESTVATYEDAKLEDGVVAVVGDAKIAADEFKFYLAQYGESLASQGGLSSDATAEEKETYWSQTDSSSGESYKDLAYKLSIDSYVGLITMTNKASENGLSITDDELSEILSQEGMEDAIAHYVDTYGTTREAIENWLKSNLLYEKYANEYIEKDERMQVSDDELKEMFNKNYLKAQHILIMTQDQETGEAYSEADKAKALETAKSILEEVKKPDADFQAIMLEKSEDPGSKEQPDGYVFTKGQMVTEFYEGAKALKENEISDIVETSYGYHIIKRLPLEEKDIETARESLENSVKTEVFQQILKEAKEEAKIKVDYEQLNAITGILY